MTNGLLSEFSDAELQYLRSASGWLGLRREGFDRLQTLNLSDFTDPTLRARAQEDVARLREHVRQPEVRQSIAAIENANQLRQSIPAAGGVQNALANDPVATAQTAEPLSAVEIQRINNERSGLSGSDDEAVQGRTTFFPDSESIGTTTFFGDSAVDEQGAALLGDSEPPPEGPTIADIAGPAEYNNAGEESDGALVVEIRGADAYVPLSNPLHDYPSYTYGISLHALTAQDYNQIMDEQRYIPTRVLVASAGRHNSSSGIEQFARAPRFKEDFYFDDLTITGYIRPTETNRNTNAVTVDFKLIEPYGFSLLERLILTAKDMGEKNYLKMPYLLQVDFFAYNNDGSLRGKIQELTKYIPITIQTLDIDLTNQGAVYTIKSTPFNHNAFNHKYAKTPINFEVKAKTVSGFFQTNENNLADIDPNIQRQLEIEAQFGRARGANRGANGSLSGDRPAFTGEISVSSYGAAINAWEQTKVRLNKAKVADVYKFVFDPEISNSSITFESKVNHLDTGFTDIDDPQQISKIATGNLGQATGIFDASRQVYAINAGTTIERVIDYVVRNSDYILKQLVIPESYDSTEAYTEALKRNNGALNWYKITPSIKLLDYDSIRGVYGQEITYHINKYVIKNVPLDIAPQGLETNPVKVYDYFYTGKNNDVLSCDIKFETLYYNSQTVYRAAMTQTNPVPEAGLNDQAANPDNFTGDADPGAINTSDLAPKEKHPTVLDARSRATGSVVYGAQVAATELERYVLSSYAGDMVTLDLGIIGDPHFIKQDDIFYTAAAAGIGVEIAPSADPRLTANGSLITDRGIVYVNVNFQIPLDYRESIGLMDFASEQFTRGIFSGIYMVTMVESNFKEGKFTQKLLLSRAHNQQETIRRGIELSQSSQNRTADTTADNSLLTPSNATIDAAAKSVDPEDTSIQFGGRTSFFGESSQEGRTTFFGDSELTAGTTTFFDDSENTGRLAQVARNATVQPISAATEPNPTPSIRNRNTTDFDYSRFGNNREE